MAKQKAARKRSKPKRAARPVKPPTMSQSEYARRRGVSREAVSKAVRERRISVDAQGRLNPDVADAEWTRNTLPRPTPTAAKPAADVPTSAGGRLITLVEAKTKREWALAQKAELELGEMAGELVRVDEVRDLVFTATRAARDKFETIPDRLADVFAGETDPDVIRRKLVVEIRGAIDELMKLDFAEPEPAAEAHA